MNVSEDANGTYVCHPNAYMAVSRGVWGKNYRPNDYSFPLFIIQTSLIVLLSRGLNTVCHRMRQPRYIYEVIAGIILGPSIAGTVPHFTELIFPMSGKTVIETMGSLGLVYFMFLVGLQMEVGNMYTECKKAWLLILVSLVPPLLLESITFLVFHRVLTASSTPNAAMVMLAASLSTTGYTPLARILAERKLLSSNAGKLAMSTAMINGLFAWNLFIVSLAMQRSSMFSAFSSIFNDLMSYTIMYYTVRPAVKRLLSPKGGGGGEESQRRVGEVDNKFVVTMLVAVMVLATLSDALGVHAMVGAFNFGMVVPNELMGAVMTAKLEDFVTGLLLPLFIGSVGMKVDVWALKDASLCWLLVGVLMFGAVLKSVSTLLVALLYHGMSNKDARAVSVLMNTRGITELIILEIAHVKKVLSTEMYTIMVLISIFMTTSCTPLLLLVNHRSSSSKSRPIPHTIRTLQSLQPETELRMIACIHAPSNVPSFMTFLRISHASKRHPVFAYALQLLELTPRDITMLVTNNHASHDLDPTDLDLDPVLKAFNSYSLDATPLHHQTVVSSYTTLHEDVRGLAEAKQAALVLLPFHQQHTAGVGLETIDPRIRTFNFHVLPRSPCSVGILVDRGCPHPVRRIKMVFFGGPDDREALAYVLRVSVNPAVKIALVRLAHAVGDEEERTLDNQAVDVFRERTARMDWVTYEERWVARGEEVVAAVKGVGRAQEMYVVGRGDGVESKLLDGVRAWTVFPELGVIGDLMASSDFSPMVLVLVVQQYKGGPEGMPVGPRISSVTGGSLNNLVNNV